MYQIILIDDEPLILAGIASLIPWEEHDCHIIGKATNGHAAIDLILETRPDIVITDIRMPVMNGLELVEACKEKNCEFACIFLTNLEDFQLARQAVHLGATDYLVKLDLQPETLIQALNKAKEHCSRMESHHNRELYTLLLKDSKEQLERQFFSQLLLHGTKDCIPADPEIAGRYQDSYVLLIQVKPEQILFGQTDIYDFSFIRSQLLDVAGGIAARCFSSHVLLVPQENQLLFVLSPRPEKAGEKGISEFCAKLSTAFGTYFALTALFGASQKKSSLSELPQALAEARSALTGCYYKSSSHLVFYRSQDFQPHQTDEREFNINFLKKAMSAAVLDNESNGLREIFDQLSQLFSQYKPGKAQAVSACINIYTYLHDLLKNESSEEGDFPYSIDIANQLSLLGTLDDILLWLDSFCQKICGLLSDRKDRRSDKLVYMAKRYIHEHYREKITLSDIADYLKISPGYLSASFSRCMNKTVSDYIAEVKIEHARELIDSGRYLIYEIADQLGFENAYYFSKVFKKVTGMAPKSYESRNRLRK